MFCKDGAPLQESYGLFLPVFFILWPKDFTIHKVPHGQGFQIDNGCTDTKPKTHQYLPSTHSLEAILESLELLLDRVHQEIPHVEVDILPAGILGHWSVFSFVLELDSLGLTKYTSGDLWGVCVCVWGGGGGV